MREFQDLPLDLGLKQRDADVEGSAVVRALAAAEETSATFKSMVIETQMLVTSMASSSRL